MTCLHIISSERALAECLSVASEQDSLLLLGSAAALAGTDLGRSALALEDDLPDGMTPSESFTLIGYPEFVQLTERHNPIITWR